RTRRGLMLAIVAIATLAAAGPAQQTGTFALLGGTQRVRAEYWTSGATPLRQSLKVRQYKPDGSPGLDYGIDMGSTMHYFIVRDDFRTFHHYTAAYSVTDGTFSHDFTMEPNHRYYLYADSHPRDAHRQVFRFTVDSAGAPAGSQPSMSASSTN